MDVTTSPRTTNDTTDTGTGPRWVEWARKIDQLANGVAVLDALGRKDWPGDDESWDRFVAEQCELAGFPCWTSAPDHLFA